MKTTNTVLMAEARTALTGKWKPVIGAFVLSWIMSSANSLASVLIAGAMAIGMATFSLGIARGHEIKLTQIFDGFNAFWVSLRTFLLTTLFVLLWAVLLIIPGIIAALAYSQVYFILSEDKKLKAMEAIEKSKAMMEGNKWKLFCLGFRFLGWILLSIVTVGVGFLWTIPYMMVTYAKFYEDIKHGHNHAEAKAE